MKLDNFIRKRNRRYLSLLEAQEALNLNSVQEKKMLKALRKEFSETEQPKPKQKDK